MLSCSAFAAAGQGHGPWEGPVQLPTLGRSGMEPTRLRVLPPGFSLAGDLSRDEFLACSPAPSNSDGPGRRGEPPPSAAQDARMNFEKLTTNALIFDIAMRPRWPPILLRPVYIAGALRRPCRRTSNSKLGRRIMATTYGHDTLASSRATRVPVINACPPPAPCQLRADYINPQGMVRRAECLKVDLRRRRQ